MRTISRLKSLLKDALVQIKEGIKRGYLFEVLKIFVKARFGEYYKIKEKAAEMGSQVYKYV